MEEFEKLQRVLNADSSEDVAKLAVERIQELKELNAELGQKGNFLEETQKLRKNIADQNVKLDKSPHRRVLYDDDPAIEELKQKRMRIYEDARKE